MNTCRPILGMALLFVFTFTAMGLTLLKAVVMEPAHGIKASVLQHYEESRFAAVRSQLPARGVVGYIQNETGQLDSHQSMQLTQYVLAPLRLVLDAEPALVLGNFPDRALHPRDTARVHFILVSDGGNGVKLYRTEAR